MSVFFPTRNFRSLPAVLRFSIPAVAGVILDLWSKHEAFARLLIGQRVNALGRIEVISHRHELLPGWIQLELTANYGAVFGAGQGMRWFFLGISLLAVAALAWLFARSERRFWLYQIVLGMLLAGVAGNLYDRAVFGYVRDMIHGLPGWRWPGRWVIPLLNYPGWDREVFPYIFNLADSYLCVGVALVMIHMYRHPHKPAGSVTPPSPEP